MFSFFVTGGPVMWAILLMGIVALVVFIERGFHLHRARIRWEDFLRGLFTVLRRQSDNEALSICSDTPGPIAALARAGIRNRNKPMEALHAAIDAAGRIEIARLERRLVIIATTAQVAPLLGLLGTIYKMIEGAVAIQQQTPLVQRADVMEPLMAALAMTAAGLTVAIPCYLAYNLLVVKVERIVLDMETAAAELLGFFSEPGDVQERP